MTGIVIFVLAGFRVVFLTQNPPVRSKRASEFGDSEVPFPIRPGRLFRFGLIRSQRVSSSETSFQTDLNDL